VRDLPARGAEAEPLAGLALEAGEQPGPAWRGPGVPVWGSRPGLVRGDPRGCGIPESGHDRRLPGAFRITRARRAAGDSFGGVTEDAA
jgi:hypothetical protein